MITTVIKGINFLYQVWLSFFENEPRVRLSRRSVTLLLTMAEVTREHQECPVCLEVKVCDIMLTRCKHSFCKECIVEWHNSQEERKTCPLCREPYNPLQDVFFATYEDRLQSFAHWPATNPIHPEDLATNGFRYIGRIERRYPYLSCVAGDDWVSCVSCNLKLGLWKEGDCVLSEHRKHSHVPCIFID